MTKAKNNIPEEDQFLKDLFTDFEPEEAPQNMRQDIMNRVFQDWTANPVTYRPMINKENRLWILLGISAILAITFLTDASVLLEYWQNLNIKLDLSNLKGLGQSFSKYYAVMQQMPAIVYFIATGILVLLGFDKLLNRLANI